MSNQSHEHWEAGAAYEQFMGHWSAQVAAQFLAWLNPDQRDSWLDVGCGTGALTRCIADFAPSALLVGVDPSLGFVQYAANHNQQGAFVGADGAALPIQASSFDVAVSGLALNFMPQPLQAVTDMRRTVKSSGMVAAYVWDYADKMEFLRYFWDAAVALDSAAKVFDEGARFPVCNPSALENLWRAANLSNVVVEALDIPTTFATFADYWQPFTVGNFPAPKYAMSLPLEQRHQLQAHLQASLPIAADGSLHLIARVWAVRGYLESRNN